MYRIELILEIFIIHIRINFILTLVYFAIIIYLLPLKLISTYA